MPVTKNEYEESENSQRVLTIHQYARNPLKRAIAEHLLKSQGDLCQRCKREKLLEIDHINHNPADWRFENLRLLCHECNIIERNSSQGYVLQEREIFSGGFGVTQEPDLEKPVEIIRNEEGEPAVREYVVEHLLRFGPNPQDTAIPFLRPSVVLSAASNYAGPNPKTCYPYFSRMTNPVNGFLEIVRHPKLKVKYLRFRYLDYYDLPVGEILQMNPKEGLRFRQEESK